MPLKQTTLDLLTGSALPFALYRLPGKSLALCMQHKPNVTVLNSLSGLNGRTGFVFAPFQLCEKYPLLLIEPEVFLKGNRAIESQIRLLIQPKNPTTDAAEGQLNSAGGKSDSARSLRAADALDKTEPTEAYEQAFELFMKALHAGSCDKIVLSRPLQLKLSPMVSMGTLFLSACEAYPDALVYLCYTDRSGFWLGITPEILLEGKGDNWQTVALAGTQKNKPSETEDLQETHWDSKNRREQQIVTSYLEKQLRIKNLKASVSQPYTIKAGNISHLKTDFQFELKDRETIGELLDFLHPTPAVCGYPKAEAFRLILSHEGYDRQYYSGFIGPLNMDGSTNLYVNLRCARFDGEQTTLFAGGGLMPDSELKTEWEETENKLQTLLSLMLPALNENN